jgi:hypothetical protein
MTEPIIQALAKRIAADVAAGREPQLADVQEYNRRTAPKPPSTRKQYGAPLRNFRIDNDRWARVETAAARSQTSAAAIIRDLIDTLPDA